MKIVVILLSLLVLSACDLSYGKDLHRYAGSLYPPYHIYYYGNGADGGTVPIDAGAYTPAMGITIASGSSMTKTASVFNWWNTKPDGSGQNMLVGGNTMPNGDLYLYAIWTP